MRTGLGRGDSSRVAVLAKSDPGVDTEIAPPCQRLQSVGGARKVMWVFGPVPRCCRCAPGPW
jgi:hypothetical protein